MHQALKSKAWKRIRELMAKGKPFIIRNQYDETKWISVNGPMYDIGTMRGWFKFCYDMGDIMIVEEVKQ